MKTSELTGAALDWAVANAKEESFIQVLTNHSHSEYLKGIRGYRITIENDTHGGYQDTFSPTTDWSQGGPIIERQEIELLKWAVDGWEAKDTNYQFLNTPNERAVFAVGTGPTPLIAAMRCFVASKLGETVEVPEELCK